MTIVDKDSIRQMEDYADKMFNEFYRLHILIDPEKFRKVFMKYANVIYGMGYCAGSDKALNHPENACKAKLQ